MFEKITLDMLNQNSVSVKKQNFIEQEGKHYPVGQPWRRAYVNSVSGRMQVQAEIDEPYRTAIFTVWGDVPTVEEPVQ